MGNDRDRLDELKQYSIPSFEYWWIPGAEQAISKWYVKVSTPLVFLAGCFFTAILLLTNWWQLFLLRLATLLYVQAWYVGWPVTLIIGGYTYYRYSRRRKRMIEQEQRRLHQLRLENAQIQLGEQGVKKRE